jgi:hypothetical protein
MNKRETWKNLEEIIPAADRSVQKECGMISEHWRQANSRATCARALAHKAQSRAELHVAAAAHAVEGLSASPRNAGNPYGPKDVKFLHEVQTKSWLAIADAHMSVAETQREAACHFAETLTTKLTARLVRQRLDALDAETVATIARLFGADLTDPVTRARVFEVCDWLYVGGGDEDRLHRHVSIPSRREQCHAR